MNVPRGLDAVGKAAFREAASILAEIGEDLDLNVSALRAYAHSESIATSIREQWLAEPRAVLTGGRGAQVANPVLRELDRAERRAADLRDALGLTPLSRRRAGRAVRAGRPAGAASARDRAQPPSRRRAEVAALIRRRCARLLATVDDAIQAGAIAREEAERRPLTRGLDPAKYGRLLDELRHATEQVVAAHELGLDVAEYRTYLDRLYGQLEADSVVDKLPQPPKRTLALRW